MLALVPFSVSTTLSVAIAAGTMGGHVNVPHVIHMQSDQFEEAVSVLTRNSTTLTPFVLHLAVFGLFGICLSAKTGAAARRANDWAVLPTHDVRLFLSGK